MAPARMPSLGTSSTLNSHRQQQGRCLPDLVLPSGAKLDCNCLSTPSTGSLQAKSLTEEWAGPSCCWPQEAPEITEHGKHGKHASNTKTHAVRQNMVELSATKTQSELCLQSGTELEPGRHALEQHMFRPWLRTQSRSRVHNAGTENCPLLAFNLVSEALPIPDRVVS